MDDMNNWKVGDNVGMGIAIAMLDKKIDPRGNIDIYTQFDT